MRDFQLPGRSAVFATGGLCATSHPLAAETAVSILRDGGNAVDAAIAAAALLGICEPHMCGIGGDCFVLLKPAGEERIVALNGSGRAPAGLDPEKLRAKGETIPPGSADAVTIPGAVDAFCRLSEDWGRIGIAAALAPAIHHAQAGVPVAERTSFDWRNTAHVLQGSARDRFLPGGTAPDPGTVFRHPALAETLMKIARNGRAGFYQGEVAEDMVAALRAAGGVHTLDDFAATASEYADPISTDYRGTELVEHPPNGQGATAILLANILGHFDIGALDPFGAARVHLEAEAAKLAYDARNRFLADPDHTARLAHMLSGETAARLAALIDPRRAMSAPAQLAEQVHRDTVYLTVVDRDRMAVSLIYSIYHSFGSGIASDRFGILFQNRGTGFNLTPGHPNEAGPGKRPMHTIIPGMLRRDDRVIMPFGVMGGAFQPVGHVRFLSNLVDFSLTPQAAIDAPRAFLDAGKLKLERGYPPSVAQELAELGHDLTVPPAPLGGAQAILIDAERGVLQGASDPRKDGAAIGY